MATLQELEKSFIELRAKIPTLERSVGATKDEIEANRKAVSDLNTRQSQLEEEERSYSNLLNGGTVNDVVKATIEARQQAIKEELEQIEKDKAELQQKMDSISEAQTELNQAKAQMEAILTEFAADPTINGYLQAAIEDKFEDKKAEEMEKVQAQEDFIAKVSSDLLDDNKFGKLVKRTQESRKAIEGKSLADISQEAIKARKNYTRNLNELKRVLGWEYEGVTFTMDDLEYIVAHGPEADGTYKVPSLVEKAEILKNAVEKIEEKKIVVIDKVKASIGKEQEDEAERESINGERQRNEAKKAEAVKRKSDASARITEIQSELVSIKGSEPDQKVIDEAQIELDRATRLVGKKEIEVRNAKSNTQRAKSKYDELVKERDDIGFDNDRYQILSDKLENIDQGISDDYLYAEQQERNFREQLDSKGYISEEVYPDILHDKEILEAFAYFRESDLAVRRAFIKCQTYDDKDMTEAKKELEQALRDYQSASRNLKLSSNRYSSNITVSSWHDYLLKLVDKDQEKNGSVDEAYYEDTMKRKISDIKSENSNIYENTTELDQTQECVEFSSKELMDLQEEFLLTGELTTDFQKRLNVKLGNYRTDLHLWAEALIDNRAKGIRSLKDLCKKLIYGIKNKFFGKANKEEDNSERKIFTKKSSVEIDFEKGLVKNLKDARVNAEDAWEILSNELKDINATTEDYTEYINLSGQKYYYDSKCKQVNKAFEEYRDKRDEETVCEENLRKANADKAEAERKLGEAKKTTELTPEQKAKKSDLESERTEKVQEVENAELDIENARKVEESLKAREARIKKLPPKTVEKSSGLLNGKGENLMKAAVDKMLEDR